jgi:hypothetical protein
MIGYILNNIILTMIITIAKNIENIKYLLMLSKIKYT